MTPTDLPKNKGFRKVSRLVLRLSFSLLIAFLFLELMLRLIPLKGTDFLSTFQFVGDKDLGYLPVAKQDAVYNIDCLRNPQVKTNSLGFRGPEWGDSKSPKVALLGDSFLLALTVSDKLHIASLLQAATGGEVWNAGVSGYGTYQELLVWRKMLKARRPEVTVLFLYLENDVRDNHCGLCRAEKQLNCPCLSLNQGNVVEQMDFELRQPTKGVKAWIKENCYSCRLLRNLTKSESPKPTTGDFWDQPSFAYNIYRPGLDKQWEEGWQVTAWALQQLKAECDALGTKLLVVNVPGVIQLATDFRAEMKSQLGSDQVPADFDLNAPIQRLTAMADSAHIPLLDMQPAFIAYRDRHQLKNPVFGWCCDGHWNPLGHRLAADLVYNDLVERSWINGPKRVTPSPVDVLGEKLMEEIYSCQTVHLD
jgi:hypothetical protein